MMHRSLTVLLLAIGVSACATMQPPPEPAGPCAVTEPVKMRWAGAKFKLRDRDAVRHDAQARIARVLRPGDPATMDFRPERLNIMVDDLGQITDLTCG
jgi:hypothetical protein